MIGTVGYNYYGISVSLSNKHPNVQSKASITLIHRLSARQSNLHSLLREGLRSSLFLLSSLSALGDRKDSYCSEGFLSNLKQPHCWFLS